MRLSQIVAGAADKRQAKPQPKKLTPAIRNKIAKAFKRAGLDGNGRFSKAHRGAAKASQVLGDFDIVVSGVLSADLFMGDKGTRSLRLEWASDKSFETGAPLPQTYLVVTWYKLDNGKYEVLAYLS